MYISDNTYFSSIISLCPVLASQSIDRSATLFPIVYRCTWNVCEF